jgi:hypothetical protein
MHVHSVKAPTLTELVDKLQEAADVIRRGLKQGGAHVVDPAILATYPTMNPNVVKAIDNGRVDLTPQEADEIYGDNSVDDVDNDPEADTRCYQRSIDRSKLIGSIVSKRFCKRSA